MISTCSRCGGRVEWKIGDAEGLCPNCGARQPVEKSDIYDQAGLLAAEGTEESLTRAMELYRSIRGWQDANRQYIACRTRLGRMRWAAESVRMKEYEDRHEKRLSRRKKLGLTVLIAVLLVIALLTTVTMIRFARYNRAAEFFIAGEYERAAEAFQAMGDYRDSRSRVYLSAVELYKAGRYEQALPYLEWLNGYPDNGYYLRKCTERLAPPDDGG